MKNNIRNITIIAHVDHGKTTMIDTLMKQSGSFRENEVVDERLMDSGELEKERGITILAKPASINWKDSRINIIDTPGHRDFAAEVERVLSMADGALLLIDSAEGVMPQTKFVLAKALKQGLRPIVIINKLDKADQRADEVLDETFDLFVSLDANEEQLEIAEPAQDLLEMEGITKELAKLMASKGISTVDELAEQSVDELTEIDSIDAEQAATLIMKARESWFADEPTEAGE